MTRKKHQLFRKRNLHYIFKKILNMKKLKMFTDFDGKIKVIKCDGLSNYYKENTNVIIFKVINKNYTRKHIKSRSK